MTALAALPNVYCKLSCLCTLDGWPVAENRRAVLETIDLFGTDRCMFASNFPVDSLRIGYVEMFRHFQDMVADFGYAERKALFHDNAVRFYRID
jgi:predicted TIM-barrel fold metal-dependent hydrolase